MKRVLFACVHNAGRSQMAAAWFNALANPELAQGISAGTEPGTHVHPEVLEAMREVGIDLSKATPRFLSTELAESAALLITMGCGETCPVVSGLRRLDWPLEDPKGKPIARVRAIRDEVHDRVLHLLAAEGWTRDSSISPPLRFGMPQTFDTASVADLPVIRAMLSAGGLPVDDVDEHVAEFILGKLDGVTIGTVAAEYAGEAALLRSLCVAPSQRGQAVGAGLLAAIEAQAASRGVRELYLLTTSAAAYFESLGFSRASREDAPSGIRGTAQFRTLCPSRAICMRKVLRTCSAAFSSGNVT